MLSSSKKRHGVVTPYSSHVERGGRRLQFTPGTPVVQHHHLGGPTNVLQSPMPTTPTTVPIANTIQNMFTFSPFGLCCLHPECRIRPQIEPAERAIKIHLKKHARSTDDYRLPIVMKILRLFQQQVENARASGDIDQFRYNNEKYICFTCICGQTFPNKKQNAIRHCKKSGCDVSKIRSEPAIRLRCGRYVTQLQIATFFNNNTPHINQQFDYDMARRVLEPFLLEIEKNDHVYTPMYLPLILPCGGETLFTSKIKRDFIMIHSPPDPISERMLILIHERAETWLCYYCQKNILMVPGNLRAGLQTFEGGEVNEVNQKTTYTMQHNPTALVSEVKKLFSFAYRRGMFSERGFDCQNDFEVATFMKDLLLEKPGSVCSHPFVVEFCLMYLFRVKKNGDEITMISCDAASSVFSKVASACKAGVCSVVCSIATDAFTVHGPLLVQAVREAPVLHILSPMVRQIREMASRIPKRRKTTLDSNGNITVDQFSFPFDSWSHIVPRSIEIMKSALSRLAVGVWWEPVVDMSSTVNVSVDGMNGDLHLTGVSPVWKTNLPLDDLDSITALLEMAFHGFGGGAARMSELERPTMFHCVYTNDSIYYTLESIKVYNHSSRKHKEIERKLPPVISRYYLLFRMLVQSNTALFEPENIRLLLPSRKNRSSFGVSNAIRDLFLLGSLPDMIQVRQFWAGVSNYVTGGVDRDMYLTSNEVGAEKMGHSMGTHAVKYSSHKVGTDESHFHKYHAAIGDTSYHFQNAKERLSLSHIRLAMESRYPHSSISVLGNYLSMGQKELVEFGYGGSGDCNQHCLGLLPPGEGKSETYLIPTIARRMANHQPRMIIHVSPYSFLAAYQYTTACAAMTKLNLRDVSICCLSGGDVTPGGLPEALQSKENLPQLLFLNLDAMHNLFELYAEDLKTWKSFIDKIVIDEIHTIFCELAFRDKYSVYHCLPALGVPIVALSGSIPYFAVSRLMQRIGLSVFKDIRDLKVIKGGDVIGDFPNGFIIRAVIDDAYLSKVIKFVIRCLGAQPNPQSAIHVFVSEKREGRLIHEALKSRHSCRFVTSENSTEEVNEVAAAWSRSEFNVLVSTSIALVGNENPKCRYLACAGYFYDRMQLVQAFGRLRKYMRRSNGAVYFAAPANLPPFREKQDHHRFTRLCNENLLSVEQFDVFNTTMTSTGIREWLIVASVGDKGCALKMLSLSFGQQREICGACMSCRSVPKRNLQEVAEQRIALERKNAQSTHRLLQKLALQCLCCRRADCRGLPILKGTGSKHLPENRGCCFSWNMCIKCGVSNHDRKTACFDKSYLNQFACCECWVYKNVQGWERHERNNCQVKGRLRRLLSHNYLQSQVTITYQKYIEGIYTSALSFCQFMAELNVKYNKQ